MDPKLVAMVGLVLVVGEMAMGAAAGAAYCAD